MCQTFICVPTLPLLSAPAHTGDSPRTRLHCASLESSDATVANGFQRSGAGSLHEIHMHQRCYGCFSSFLLGKPHEHCTADVGTV